MKFACAIDCHVLVSPSSLSTGFCSVVSAFGLFNLSVPRMADVLANLAIYRLFYVLSVHGFQVTKVVYCLRRSVRCAFAWRGGAMLVQTVASKPIRH
ncbi:hypothetical protein BJ322DRAFT_121002 [Thelephora terrestris]|uniref:Uncharacterized protein n=1 Tax=Thelephora terrestris TaxID=56493 RepID=A0A9P6LDU2_9AGAM|nr:hypothetical protein BJ322DRAFT_121002 [Thelephora terrestris]